jgi:hypothetical protein
LNHASGVPETVKLSFKEEFAFYRHLTGVNGHFADAAIVAFVVFKGNAG